MPTLKQLVKRLLCGCQPSVIRDYKEGHKGVDLDCTQLTGGSGVINIPIENDKKYTFFYQMWVGQNGTTLYTYNTHTAEIGGSVSGGLVPYIIEIGSGNRASFMHLDSVWLAKSKDYGTYELIYQIGSTGTSSGPHIHLSVNGGNTNPWEFIKGA